MNTTRPSSKGKTLAELDIRYCLDLEGNFYPIHLDADLFVTGWRGPVEEGDKLIGFQRGSTQHIDLHTKDFVADPTSAVGLSPVFSDGDTFYAIDATIEAVEHLPNGYR